MFGFQKVKKCKENKIKRKKKIKENRKINLKFINYLYILI